MVIPGPLLRVGLLVVLLAVPFMATAPGTAAQRATRPRDLVIENTLSAALAQPRVHVQVRRGRAPLTAKPPASPFGGPVSGDGGRDVSFLAYLDTGTSGCVVSRATAERFGIDAIPGAVYHEVGLHGETPVGVSRVYAVALGNVIGLAPTAPPDSFSIVQREAVFQLANTTPKGLMALLGPIDVAGMPAIRRVVVEIVPPGERFGCGNQNPDQDVLELLEARAAPSVTIHPKGTRPKGVGVEVQLEYIDYNRRKHPGNQGPLPALEANPVIREVVSTHEGNTFTGDWLLDTGAAASIVSVAHAARLGLVDAAGAPLRAPDFTLPLGGVSGTVRSTPGYVIDSIHLPALKRSTLEFRKAHVVVQDVGFTRADGTRVVLDGVLGMNLLLHSAADLERGLSARQSPSAFARIWIDGPRGRLGLELRAQAAP